MDFSQELFNVVISAAGALGSFFMYAMWDELKSLRKKNDDLAAKTNAVEVLVAGQYVRRDELVRSMERLEAKIDANFKQVFDKLDDKADKS